MTNSTQLHARDILPGMTIKYADAWFKVQAISMVATSQRVLGGSATFLADVIGADGQPSRLLLHGDEYGYRVRTYSARVPG
jgi:hypothetical protein